MLSFGIVVVAIAALTGWLVKRHFDKSNYEPNMYSQMSFAPPKLTGREFVVGLIFISMVLVPAVFFVGNRLSVASTLKYEEFYNGYEIKADRFETICRAGVPGSSRQSGQSNCHWQYNTGVEYKWETLELESYSCTDAQGNASTCSRLVTVEHEADIYHPYAQVEHTFAIEDSLGEKFRFPTVYIPVDGQPFDPSVPIPGNIPRGEPEEWTESYQRLAAGDARSVTRVYTYDNYILAARDDMLLPFSQDVARYSDAGLLPDHTENILTNPLTGFNGAFAHKISFVGLEVSDTAAWQESVMGFNAVLGSQLRGDLHMVAIDSSLVDDPTNYLNALKAHWVGDAFGRRAIAKNAIIVVVGVQDGEVQWAKASTGMPFGNETMIHGIENFLHGVPFTPEAVIGDPRISVSVAEDGEHEAQYHLADQPGVLEEVVLRDFPFKRACMTCADSDDEGVGYDNLVAKIPPSPLHLFFMAVVVTILAIGAWLYLASSDVIDRVILGLVTKQPKTPAPHQYNNPPKPKKYRNR